MNTKEKFVSLMSAGTDSPVACYLMIKNGFTPIIVHFHLSPSNSLSDKILEEGLFRLIKILRNYTDFSIKTYLIPHKQIISQLEMHNFEKNICIACRRMMYRIAKEIASMENAKAIVTGESLGEKASQTPKNLFVIKQAIDNIIIIQPLIALTKLEIEAIAKEIGTYEFSIQNTYKCSATPQYPVTHADLAKIKELEKTLNIRKIIEKSLENASITSF